jgi:hypothetical protein
VQNADRDSRRTAAGVTAGSAADTFGDNEPAEPDSDDDHQVPEPATATPANSSPAADMQEIVTLLKDMNPASQHMFLSLMTKMRAGTEPEKPKDTIPLAPPAPAEPASIPRIFNAAAVQPARSEDNLRTPFSPRIMELAQAGVYMQRSIFTNECIQDMFVNQSDQKYQPKKRTVFNEGKTIQVYTLDPSIFNDETTLSHIRFDEAHTNYRRWFVENAPVGAAAQLEAYDNHRQSCRDVVLEDELDFVMIQRWDRSWMQRQTWNPTTWDGVLYHQEFELHRARYFEAKVSKQVKEVLRLNGQMSKQALYERSPEKPRSTYPERTSSSSYPERQSPYSRERPDREQQRSFRKDALCLKCGDTGHMARECRAEKTIKGSPTKIFFEGGKIFWIAEPKTQVCVAWNLHGACEAKNANLHCHACTLCGTTKHHAASGKC